MADWLTLLHAMVGIVVVLWRKEVILALLLSLCTAELLMYLQGQSAGPGLLLDGSIATLERIVAVTQDGDNARILMFSLLVGGLLAYMRDFLAKEDQLPPVPLVAKHFGWASANGAQFHFMAGGRASLDAAILWAAFFCDIHASQAFQPAYRCPCRRPPAQWRRPPCRPSLQRCCRRGSRSRTSPSP